MAKMLLCVIVAVNFSRTSFLETRFHFTMYAHAPLYLWRQRGTLDASEVLLVPLTPRDLQMEGKGFCILNMVRAIGEVGSSQALLCYSDLSFMSSILAG